MGYVDSDYVGDLNNKTSLTGYLFTINNCTKQLESYIVKSSGLSTTEVEYTVGAKAFKKQYGSEAYWINWDTFNISYVFCNSKSAICLSKNQVHYEKTKHIDIKLHFIRLEGSKGTVQLVKIHTNYNIVDILTKINSNY